MVYAFYTGAITEDVLGRIIYFLEQTRIMFWIVGEKAEAIFGRLKKRESFSKDRSHFVKETTCYQGIISISRKMAPECVNHVVE